MALPMKIAAVLPCFRVKKEIADVIRRIGPEVSRIFVVDDCCPEKSGEHVKQNIRDPRVTVIFHEKNQGVGGAVITGYKAALSEGMDIVLKVDGDGQMTPELIPDFIRPILNGEADYTKGNRFFRLGSLRAMPWVRLFGNSALSFIVKATSGYWNIMDPTNGYTAIHSSALQLLDLDKLDQRYFFESDLLFRLNTVRAVVRDIPMNAKYENEQSSLRVSKILVEFPPKYLIRFIKRVFYSYFLRDFNIGTLQLVAGLLLCGFGAIFGGWHYYRSITEGVLATSGTVMLAGLPIILGVQSLWAAIQFDFLNIPSIPLQSTNTTNATTFKHKNHEHGPSA